MIKLFNYDDYIKTAPSEMLPLKCENPYCDNVFHVKKTRLKRTYNYYRKTKAMRKLRLPKYCSNKCSRVNRKRINTLITSCICCKRYTTKKFHHIRHQDSNNYFCSSSCSASYNNQNKTHGTTRSKLEKWLEKELNKKYSHLNILFNSKEAIKSELDIYIPELKLAFEINGIFHYKPIFGEKKLKRILKNDQRKKILCEKKGITLITIDSSKQQKFNSNSSKKFLNEITTIIEEFKHSA